MRLMQLMWFRHDLRAIDNLALQEALSNQQPLIALYIHCPDAAKRQAVGERRQWFHLQHVNTLFTYLVSKGIPCFYREVPTYNDIQAVMLEFIQNLPIAGLTFTRAVGVWEQQRDESVRLLFAARGLSVTSVEDDSILPVDSVRQANGQPYKVFTPFKKAWYSTLDQVSLAFHRTLPTIVPVHSLALQSGLQLLNDRIEALAIYITPQIVKLWPIGLDAALVRLNVFKSVHLSNYDKQRDFPNKSHTSGLSPYLASGVVSARQLFLEGIACQPSQGRSVWLSELIWRDFYRQIMHNFPRVSKNRCFNQDYETLAWRQSDTNLKAWQEGKTGVPLVDAGMRQLNETGWMHNRVRMVTAMFLSKNLFLDWRLGEHYFMQQLLDGDFPSNNGGWQWSASVGTDAAPYFRVFNPLTQAERFDPECEYIKKYVPELRSVNTRSILKADQHQAELQQVGYVKLLVDVKETRQQAIEAFKSFRALNKS